MRPGRIACGKQCMGKRCVQWVSFALGDTGGNVMGNFYFI
jgi:hypothetical protein